MLIKWIEIENIRSYVREKIEFPCGLIFLRGDIGAGKSTILMAIKFALFGEKSVEYSEFMREGASNASVSLNFVVNGKEYTVRRRLKRDKRGKVTQEKVKIIKEGVESGELRPTEADEYILKIISPDWKIKKQMSEMYNFALYVPQEAMKEIMSTDDKKGREAKRETISKLFGCDVYERARKNAEEVKNKLENEKENLEEVTGKGYENLYDKEKRLDEIKNEIKAKEAGLEDLEKTISGLENEVKTLEAQKEEMERRRKRRENLLQDKARLDEKVRSINKEIDRSEQECKNLEIEIENLRKEYKESEPAHIEYINIKQEWEEEKRKREKHEKAANLLGEKRGFLKKLHKEIEELKRKVAEEDELRKKYESYGNLEEEISKLEAEKEQISGKISGLESEIKREKKEIEELEKEKRDITGIEGRCPKCKQPITREHVGRIVCEIEEKIKDHNETIKKLEEDSRKNKERKKELEAMLAEKKRLQKEWNEIASSLRQVEREKEALEAKSKEAEKIGKEIEGMQAELKSIGYDEKRYKEIEKKLGELEKVEKERTKLESSIKEKEAFLARAKAENARRRNEIVEAEERISRIGKEIEEVGYDEGVHRNIQVQYNQKHGDLQAMKQKEEDERKNLEEKKRQMEEVEKEVKELREKRDKIEKLKKYMEFFEKLSMCYEKIGNCVLEDVRYNLDVKLREFFMKLRDSQEMEITLNEDFTPEIRIEGGYVRPLSALSGGESTAVALAYRLALNEVVNEKHFGKSALLILDEPTDGFSSEQMNTLAELLSIAKQRYEAGQIFVVSHESELEWAADFVYDVKKTEEGTKVKRRSQDANC